MFGLFVQPGSESNQRRTDPTEDDFFVDRTFLQYTSLDLSRKCKMDLSELDLSVGIEKDILVWITLVIGFTASGLIIRWIKNQEKKEQ